MTTSGNFPTIAYLGPRGTFTEQAMLRFIRDGIVPGSENVKDLSILEGPDSPLVPVNSAPDALEMLREGKVEWAVVALENSVDGPVSQTFDALVEGDPVQIVSEIDIPIEFAIVANDDIRERYPFPLSDDALVYSSHPVASTQVRNWMKEHFPNAEYIPASSNGAAAQAVVDGQVDLAAAPRAAADVYDLEIMADHVADVRRARTRFVLVGHPQPSPAPTGKDRTAVAIKLKNEPAALARALQELSLRGVDLSRLEARPTRGNLGTYIFHIECQGHITQEPIQQALMGLKRRSEEIRFFGSWPQSDFDQDQEVINPPSVSKDYDWLQNIIDGKNVQEN